MLCVLQQICLPVPEATTVLLGMSTIGHNFTFFLTLAGDMIGITIMYYIVKTYSKKFLKEYKNNPKFKTYKKYISHNPFLTTGILFAIPILPDEIIIIGSTLGDIALYHLISIALFSKILSVGMMTYSKQIGHILSLKQWEVIILEIIIMLIAAIIYKFYKDHQKRSKN